VIDGRDTKLKNVVEEVAVALLEFETVFRRHVIGCLESQKTFSKKSTTDKRDEQWNGKSRVVVPGQNSCHF